MLKISRLLGFKHHKEQVDPQARHAPPAVAAEPSPPVAAADTHDTANAELPVISKRLPPTATARDVAVPGVKHVSQMRSLLGAPPSDVSDNKTNDMSWAADHLLDMLHFVTRANVLFTPQDPPLPAWMLCMLQQMRDLAQQMRTTELHGWGSASKKSHG